MSSLRIHSIDALEDIETLKSLASEQRIRILMALRVKSANVNDLGRELGLPQSTVATNVLLLERAGLIRTETVPAKKGSQKICHGLYQEIVVRIPAAGDAEDDLIEVQMPIGLYTAFEVSPPCGLCSAESIIGFLDSPDAFLSPDRMKAGLLWFEKGWVEYKFPNNGLYRSRPAARLEVCAELSSQAPGADARLLSDITMWINDLEIGTWTSAGGAGDRRGKLTPAWWKPEGSQYGFMKRWSVTREGAFVDGVRVSGARIDDLVLGGHRSIKVRLGVKDGAERQGGMKVFGKGFGNYDSDLVLSLGFD